MINTLLMTLVFAGHPPSPAPTAASIIEEVRLAHGGEALESLTHIQQTAKTHLEIPGLVKDMHIKRTYALNHCRLVTEHLDKARPMRTGFDGETSWQVPEMPEGLPLGKDTHEQDWAHYLPVWLVSNQITYEYVGEKDWEGRQYLVLRMEGAHLNQELWIDAASHLIARTVSNEESRSGRQLEEIMTFEDYKPVGELLLPHTIRTTTNTGVNIETTITGYETNPDVTPNFFSPENAAAEPRHTETVASRQPE